MLGSVRPRFPKPRSTRSLHLRDVIASGPAQGPYGLLSFGDLEVNFGLLKLGVDPSECRNLHQLVSGETE